MIRVPDQASFDGMGAASEKNRGQHVGKRGMYVVRGPQGEFYGRYPHPPRPEQIPLYATVELEKPGWKVGFGENDEEEQSVF